MKRWVIAAAIVIIVAGGVAVSVMVMRSGPNTIQSQNTDTSPTPDEPQSGEVTVRMQNTKFSPQSIRITKGTKVTWVNDDSVQHNIVATDAGNTGGLPTQNSLFGKGGSYSFTFDAAGSFKYHCTPHPFMTGTVIVE